MTIISEEAIATNCKEAAGNVSMRLGLPPDFLDKIFSEDDWSFILKAHALLEAAMVHLLSCHVDVRLAEVFKKDGMSRCLDMVSRLSALSNEQIKFMRKFSWLRNRFVHDIHNIGGSLADLYESLDQSKKDDLLRSLSINYPENGDAIRDSIEKSPNTLKFYIFLEVQFVLTVVYFAGVKKEQAEMQLDILSKLKSCIATL